jgi:hypothetical protein
MVAHKIVRVCMACLRVMKIVLDTLYIYINTYICVTCFGMLIPLDCCSNCSIRNICHREPTYHLWFTTHKTRIIIDGFSPVIRQP